MFLLLILVSLAAALITTILVVLAFRESISSILARIVDDVVGEAWRRYLVLALFVVGLSSGVNTWTLERALSGGEHAPPGAPALELGPSVVALEAYKAALGSLRGLAAALLLFFAIGLVVSAIQRGVEQRSAGARSLARRSGEPSRVSREPASRSGRERGGGDSRRSGGRRRGPERPRPRPEETRGSGNDRRGEERTGDVRNGTEAGQGRSRPLSRFVDRHS